MQFPVPQFTDVEDKIIGTFTIKQFGIIFGAGIIIFLGYSSTKSILVLVFLFMLFGVPALALAFAKINGRPLYNTISYFFKFLSTPKFLVFHKEVSHLTGPVKLKDANLEENKPIEQRSEVSHQATLKEVQKLLSETAEKEREMANKMR